MQWGRELVQKFGQCPMSNGCHTALWQDAAHASTVLSLSLFSILSFILLCFPLLLFPPTPYTFILPNFSVQSLSPVRLFATPWITARQASLSITNSWSLPKIMSIESVMPSNHLILCRPLLLLPSIFPNIRVFSNESALCIRWPKYWSFSFTTSPSSEYPGVISFRMDWWSGPIRNIYVLTY